MLTLYARYNNDELRALQGFCLDFCCHQYDKDSLYSDICANCEKTPRLQRPHQFSTPL